MTTESYAVSADFERVYAGNVVSTIPTAEPQILNATVAEVTGENSFYLSGYENEVYAEYFIVVRR